MPIDVSEPLAFEQLLHLLERRRIAVLTGAGCSTESGIPDYRGPLTRAKARNPVQYRAFVTSASARARYWARSALGWPRFRDFKPNAAHQAIASLQRAGRLTGLLTQNVDQLHQKAGSRELIELHGALAGVRCLSCGTLSARDELQPRLLALNPTLEVERFELAPDGDADLPDHLIESFRVPACEQCEGVLKPDVVFFGESVPRPRVDAALQIVDDAEVLLVVGSSLEVFSGHRYVLRAAERDIPVALINLGPSRADAHAHVHVDAKAGEVLPKLVAALGVPS
jgi:NAD-dependent SIR2 family protein deacetylase